MLTEAQIDKVCDEVAARLEKIYEARHKQVVDLLLSIQKTSDIAYGELDNDRQNLAQMSISMRSIEESQRQIVDLHRKTTEKVAQSVADEAQKVVDSTAEAIAERVEPAMKKAVKKLNSGIPLGNGRPWWKFW